MPDITNEFSQRIIVYVFDRNGSIRRYLPQETLISCDWNLDRYGGNAQFSLSVAGTIPIVDALQQGDRVEIWYLHDDGEWRHRYAGFISRILPKYAETNSYDVVGYGFATIAGSPTVKRKFAYSGPTDITQVFSDICLQFISPYYLNVIRDVTPSTITVTEYDYRGRTVKDSYDTLVDLSANTLTWGFYWDPDTQTNILRIKPIGDSSNPDHNIFTNASYFKSLTPDDDGLDIANAVSLTGGNRLNPNAIYNGHFSEVITSGNGVGNLFTHGGFNESTGSMPTDWVGSGSFKTSSDSTKGSYEGGGVVELDNVTENLRQYKTGIEVDDGFSHNLSIFAILENPLSSVQLTIDFFWTMGGVTIGDIVGDRVTLNYTLLGTDFSNWKKIFIPIGKPPSGTDGFHFDVELTSGGGTGNGVYLDLAELYNTEKVYQDGWEIVKVGTAEEIMTKWDEQSTWDYDYCVRTKVKITTSAFDNMIVLQPRNQARFNVQKNQHLTLSLYVRIPPSSGGSFPQTRILIECFESNGNHNSDRFHDYSPGYVAADGDWHLITFNLELGAFGKDEVAFRPYIQMTSDGEVEFDGFCVRDVSEPASIPHGPFKQVFRAQEMFGPTISGNPIAGYSGDHSSPSDALYYAYNSESKYGWREKSLNLQVITKLSDALAYMDTYFKASTETASAPRLKLVGIDNLFLPGEIVNLATTSGDFSYPIVRVSHSYSMGILSTNLELHRESRDESFLLLEIIRKRLEAEASSNNYSNYGNYQSGASTGISVGQGAVTPHEATHLTGGSDALTGNLDAIARVSVRKNSTGSVYSRRRINLIEGSNSTITIADDSTDEEVDVTVQSNNIIGLRSVTGAITLLDTDEYIIADATGGAFTITLPVASGVPVKRRTIRCIGGIVTFSRSTSDVISNGSYTTVTTLAVDGTASPKVITLVNESGGLQWIVESLY